MKNHNQELEITLILNELEKDCELRPSQTSYLVNYCKNQQEEIARLKNAIDKITSIMNEYDFSYNDEWYEEPTSQELRDDYYAQSYIDIHRVYLILQELNEKGKSQEIPLFEGTMEQLDNLTILKGEGNKDK